MVSLALFLAAFGPLSTRYGFPSGNDVAHKHVQCPVTLMFAAAGSTCCLPSDLCASCEYEKHRAPVKAPASVKPLPPLPQRHEE